MEFRDLKTQYSKYKEEIDEAIQNVLLNARFIGGDPVSKLEKRLADYIGVKHCISCANGTEAMTLLLMAWDIGPGDAVFVPDFTFFSTAEVVSFRGATPIFVDVKYDTFNIDPDKLDDAVAAVKQQGQLKPKVVIPVDLFGQPAEYEAIQNIAKKYDLLILEDAAQGFGGNINGKMAGSFGDAATTSFFPAKPLGCYGDGGAIFTNCDELAIKLSSLKVHGKGENKYDNVLVGVNSRLDTIQAAILDVKLSAFVNHELDDVNEVATIYNELLEGAVDTPVILDNYYSSYAQYTIKLESPVVRDKVINELNACNIPSMVYYSKPLHLQKAFDYLGELSNDRYTVCTKLSSVVLSLPMHPYLKRRDIERICNIIKNCV